MTFKLMSFQPGGMYLHVVGKGDVVVHNETGELAEILGHEGREYVTTSGRWDISDCEWVGDVNPGFTTTTTGDAGGPAIAYMDSRAVSE